MKLRIIHMLHKLSGMWLLKQAMNRTFPSPDMQCCVVQWKPVFYLRCEMLIIPHCLDDWLRGGGKVGSLMHWLPIYTPETLFFCFWYSFLIEVE
jgi:hypothetical protein